MKRPRFYLLIILIFTLEVFAESSKVLLNEGIVITKVDTIKGDVKVDLSRNVVSVKDGSRYYSLVASQIHKVVVSINGKRQAYFSGVFGADGKHMLFEILSYGDAILLFREGVKFSQFDEEAFPPFFVAKENSIYSVASKKEVLAHMDSKASLVKTFVKENKTDFNEKESLAALFHFYNGIDDPSKMFAFKD